MLLNGFIEFYLGDFKLKTSPIELTCNAITLTRVFSVDKEKRKSTYLGYFYVTCYSIQQALERLWKLAE